MAQTIRAAILGADRAAEDEADRVARRVVDRLLQVEKSPNDTTVALTRASKKGILPLPERAPEDRVAGDVAAVTDMTAIPRDVNDAPDQLLTVGDVARLLTVKRSKAYEIWATLPKVKLGPRCHRVRRDALDHLLSERERRPRWR